MWDKSGLIAEKKGESSSWLNRNVFAFGLTSFLSDFGHEMATAILPQFMRTIGSSAAALGLIEGFADALSSFVKLGAGFHSDKIGHRKRWTLFGYILTGLAKAVFAFAFAWPLIFVGRAAGWLGRGIRGPIRDAMLAESVAPEDRGKAFGFHRAADTLGAVAGPLTAFCLLTLISNNAGLLNAISTLFPSLKSAAGNEFRIVFLLTLLPGILSVVSIWVLVTEKKRAPDKNLRLMGAIQSMPRSYFRFLLAVGLFGMADFAPTLLILRATTLLEPQMGFLQASKIGALLYLLRNAVYAAASYPIGVWSDKVQKTTFLSVGYGIAALTFAGFALAAPSLAWLTVLFGFAGVFIAWEDTVEGAAIRDHVGQEVAGTAFGVLGVVNGIGDLTSSLLVGVIWSAFGPEWGFGYAALIGAAGTALTWYVGRKQSQNS